MNTAPTLDREELELAPRALFELPDISGVQLGCRRGSLWITLDNDPRDIVLEAGESFFSTEHRRALVYAFEASVLAIRTVAAREARETPAPRRAGPGRNAFAR
jgi:hypothetical protein